MTGIQMLNHKRLLDWSVKRMTNQEQIIEKIQKCCDYAIDCGDNCMFFSEKYDECIFHVLGLGSPYEWECENNGKE